MADICFTWDTANFLWNDNPYTWDDVCFAQELLAGHSDISGWSQEKKKRFIELYIKVKKQTEPEIFYGLRPLNKDSNKEVKDIDISIENVSFVIKNVLNVTVEI